MAQKITNGLKLQAFAILEILAYNGGWATAEELAPTLSGGRVRACIHHLRCCGYGILSHPAKGYRLSSDQGEIMETAAKLLRRAAKIIDAAEGMLLRL